MALVHERLYGSESLANIDVADYLKSLLIHLLNTYQVDDSMIQFDLNGEPVRLSLDTAVPAGLAVNELGSSFLKYAFLGDCRGVIGLGLAWVREEVVLRVQEDGVSLPKPSIFAVPKRSACA